MFAIYEKYRKSFLLSTDKKCLPYRQRLSKDRMMLFETRAKANMAFVDRRCDKERFEVVEVYRPMIKKHYSMENYL